MPSARCYVIPILLDGFRPTHRLHALFERGYHGTFHHVSAKHLGRYVSENSGRHKVREADTIDQTRRVAMGLTGKRLRYEDLIAGNG